MNFMKKILCAIAACAMITPYNVFAENNSTYVVQTFSTDENSDIELFSDDLAITAEENNAIDYFVQEAKNRTLSVNFDQYSITAQRFNELLNYILLNNPELYIIDIANTSLRLSADNMISSIELSYNPEEETKLVAYLAKEMRNRTQTIDIGMEYTITESRFYSLFQKVCVSTAPYSSYMEKYYPELFYVDTNSLKINTDDDNYVESITLSYNAPINENEEELMDKIIEGFANRSPKISVNSEDYGIDYSRFYYIIQNCLSSLIQNEHPELFYVDISKILMGYNPNTNELSIYAEGTYNEGTEYEFTTNAYLSEEEIKAKQALIDAECDKIISLVTEDMSPIQKLLVVHDYIAANYEYDTTYQVRTLDAMVEQKKGVCQGYSYLFKYVLDKLDDKNELDEQDFDCVTVPSSACSHMWNKIKLDGEWYNIDITHDDPIPNRSSNISHTHFLVNDEELKDTDKEHKFQNLYKWDGETPAEISDSNVYSGTPLHNISSQTIYSDGSFYCFDSKNNLCVIDFYDNETKLYAVYKNSSDFKWKYEGNFSAMALYNGDIYFNSPHAVFRFNPKNKSAKKVFSYDRQETDMMIYGLTVKNNTLYMECADNINEGVKLIPVTLTSQMPCSSEIIDNENGTVTVKLSIPEDIEETVKVMIAEFDENGILIGFAEHEENQDTVNITPENKCKKITAFIWNINNTPLADLSSYTFSDTGAENEKDVKELSLV